MAVDPTVECLKQTNIARSFYKYIDDKGWDVRILYGDQADEFPENPDTILPRAVATVLLVKFNRFAGGRGEDPHNVSIQVWTRKAMDPYGAVAEQWRDTVISALNVAIPMYSFSTSRATPELIGENYNLYPRFEGSYPLTDEGDQIAKWDMLYSVYSWRGSARY